jgi:holo-[acyl-carrier protein] synthase
MEIMMKTGIDIIETNRLIKLVNNIKFLEKCFTPNEIEYFNSKPGKNIPQVISGHFALKEATAKALETGLMREGVGFKNIEIKHKVSGAPYVILNGQALKIFEKLGTQIEVSISHTDNIATAICVIM